MEMRYTIDVANLDAAHQIAIEDLIGVPLQANQRLIITVTDIIAAESEGPPRPASTLEDWRSVYKGLTEGQIEEIDRIANTRATFTREMP